VAEDLVPGPGPKDVVVPPADPTAPVPVEPRKGSGGVYRLRFGFAYLALALLAGAGIGAAVLLLDRPTSSSGLAWSNWQPTGSESSYASQIADYVSGRYRLPSGKPLVAILAGPPEVQDVAVRAVAIQNDPEGASDDISIVPTENSVMFVLCGLGPRCSIREGEPSEERHRLLRREALELALYALKYSKASSVIALLPPRPDAPDAATGTGGEAQQNPSTALFFEKKDFVRELDVPLRRTLLSAEPPQVAEISSLEGPTIDRLTTPHLFSYEFQQAQEGSAILILAPLGR
jgi:hypothetical protein